MEVTRAITKHNYLVMDIKDLPRVIKEAFYLARWAARPRPHPSPGVPCRAKGEGPLPPLARALLRSCAAAHSVPHTARCRDPSQPTP